MSAPSRLRVQSAACFAAIVVLFAAAAIATLAAGRARAETFEIPRSAMHSTSIEAPLSAARNAGGPSGPASSGVVIPPIVQGVAPQITNSVSTAGNIDGAGFSEQLVGFPNLGAGGNVNIFYRGPGSPVNQTLLEPVDHTSFGASVTAADVNGDGFNDVIVGDPLQSDAGGTQNGAIYVYNGTSLGVSQFPTTKRSRPGDFAYFGYSVSFAGDVNSDGYDDVVVGSPTYSDDQSNEGVVYLYLGGPTGLAATPVWTKTGDHVFGWFGYDVSCAGDVNGDGYDDLVVGEPFYSNGQSNEGQVTLFLGSASGIQPANSVSYESNLGNTLLGWSVCTAGDANGDGYADWAAGAPNYSNGESTEGAVYFFQGAASLFLAPAPKIAEGNSPGHNFGVDVSPCGDFNGDGLGDLVAGRPGYSDITGSVGAITIILGTYDLTAWPFSGTFAGPVVNGSFGRQVSVGGDLDGDGFSDALSLDTSGALAPGDGGAGEIGEGGPLNPPQLVSVDGFTLVNLGLLISDAVALGPYGGGSGWSVAVDGDVNGDGFDDVLVGAPNYFNTGSQNGLVELFFGHADRPGTVPPPPFIAPLPDWSFTTSNALAQLGYSVAYAGDVNADGYDDVIVGAPEYTNGQALEGAAFVFYGSPGGLSGSPDWTIESNEIGARYATSVASAGDVNGDGYADVLVGAFTASHGASGGGACYLYYGSAFGLSHAPARKYDGAVPDLNLGEHVAGIGDIDGDGYDDFAIGAPGFANGQANEGAILFYKGAPAGPSGQWDLIESNSAGAAMGRAFDGAGDVNGDGKGDLVVGMSAFAAAFPQEGRVAVYHGSNTGFALAPEVFFDGGSANLQLGFDVSAAGDVNLDGYSDIVVGLPGENGNGGGVLVYPGTALGVETSPLTGYNNFAGERLGTSVAGGGDLNGDGYGDFVAGEPSYQLPKGFGDGGVLFFLAGTLQPNTIADRPADAVRPLATTNIGTGLRSDSQSAYRIHALVRSPAGRTRVRAQVESKPVGAAFNGLGLVSSAWAKVPSPSAGHPDVLATNVNVTGLAANTKYHWRTRYATRSIWFNPSPWLSPQANAPTQGDVRTAGGTIVDAGSPSQGSSLALAGARPNPASVASVTTIAYTLPRNGRVRLTLHDVSGRLVRRLVDRDERAGANAIAWDLRDQSGVGVSAGVYFAKLAFAGENRETKVVVLP
jgi:hypothetical protein